MVADTHRHAVTITRTVVELFRGINMDVLKDYEPQKYKVLVILAIFGCGTHFKSELR